MTEQELMDTLLHLNLNDAEKEKAVVCALIGHSNIFTNCFGYKYCARCGAQIGDSFGGYWNKGNRVFKDCDEVILDTEEPKLTWQDKFMVEYKTMTLKEIKEKERLQDLKFKRAIKELEEETQRLEEMLKTAE